MRTRGIGSSHLDIERQILASQTNSLKLSEAPPVMGITSEEPCCAPGKKVLKRAVPISHESSSAEMTWGTKEAHKKRNFENLIKLSTNLLSTVHEKSVPIRQWAITELLAKQLAYSRPEHNTIFYIPWTNHEDGTPKYEKYTCKVVNISKGVPLFILVPKSEDLPPLFVFRGTSPYSLHSIYANFSLEAVLNGIGSSIFKEARPLLAALLKTYASKTRGVFCGHSLGGSLTQLASVEFSDRIAKAYSFNAPKVSSGTAQKWRALGDSVADLLWNTRTKGDIASYGGTESIGREFVIESPSTSKVDLHSQTVLQGEKIVFTEPAPKTKATFVMQLEEVAIFFSLQILKILKIALSILFIETFYYLNQVFQHTYTYLLGEDYGRTDSFAADRAYKNTPKQTSWEADILTASSEPPSLAREQIEEILEFYAKLWWNLEEETNSVHLALDPLFESIEINYNSSSFY